MNAVLLTGFVALCGLCYMAAQLYLAGLPSVCH